MAESVVRSLLGRARTGVGGYYGSLRGRLLLGSLIPLVLFLAAALVAYVTILTLTRAEEDERRAHRFLSHAHQLKAHLALMAAAHRGHHLLGQPQFKRNFDAQWKEAQGSLELLEELGTAESRKPQIDQLAGQVRKWHDAIEPDFFEFIPTPADSDEAYRYLDKTIAEHDEIIEAIDQVVQAEHRELDERLAEVHAATMRGLWLIPLAATTAIVLSLVIPLQLSRTISEPLRRLSAATEELRQGKFTTHAHARGCPRAGRADQLL
jgi:CHASE3 domain sensor protein